MSLPLTAKFYLFIRGNGTDTSITITLATAPIYFEVDNSAVPSVGFNLSTLKPTDVKDVSTTGLTISSASIGALGTQMTIVFASAPSADTEFKIEGNLIF